MTSMHDDEVRDTVAKQAMCEGDATFHLHQITTRSTDNFFIQKYC